MEENSAIVVNEAQSSTLNTIQVIEQTIESHHDFETVDDLYNALPHDVQYTTFTQALAQLKASNKIAYDRNGAVFWIFAGNNPKLIDLERNSIPLK